ncbi:MAG TPA: GNAT family N-acetyltransferase, partial [Terriglobia bacterium]|nr:GNAT family N-acetyltransferase [Terriglobia bacterium]
MKLVTVDSYRLFDQKVIAGRKLAVWITHKIQDQCWDRFLEGTPLGQFQQSSLWAAAKSTEGWLPIRVVLTLDDEIAGGFQILHKSKWWGHAGYLSKGPVVLPEPGLGDFTTQILKRVCRQEGLRLLVIQPPDASEPQTMRLDEGNQFDLLVPSSVIDATLVIDLREGFEAAKQRMRKVTHQRVKQAINRGITVREGRRDELETFFTMMLATCRRQEESPNPAHIEHLQALAGAPGGAERVRIFFAEFEGKPLSGILYVAFGKTLSMWRRGWDDVERNRHPNDLAVYEGIRWAHENRFDCFDFCGLDRKIAMTLLSEEPLTTEQMRSRHIFHIRFGGGPRLLPQARVHLPNPLLRLAYRMWFSRKLAQARKDNQVAAEA